MTPQADEWLSPPDARRSMPLRERTRERISSFRIAIGIACLVGLVGVGVLLYSVLTYAPLERGAIGGTQVFLPDGKLAKESTSYDPQTVWEVHSTRFKAEVVSSLLNSGRFTVTVESVRLAGWWPVVGKTHALDLGTNFGFNWDHGRPFRPFSLAPGQERLIELSFAMHCLNTNAPDAYISLTSVEVDYGFLGVSHSMLVPLVEPLSLSGPGDCLVRRQ